MLPLLLSLAAAAAYGYAYRFASLASPLNDAYIYFQYARQAAHGAWFIYADGGSASTGVSGLLFFFLLSGLARLGLEGPMAAWSLGCLFLFLSLVAWQRLMSRLAPQSGPWIPALLFVSLGPLGAAYFNGLETGLFFALLFWSLEAISDPSTGSRRLPWLLALLAFARPEGQVAACIFALALLWRRPLACLPVLFAALAPSLLIHHLTGSWVPDSLRPKSAYFMALPWRLHLQVSLLFISHALKDYFMNLGGLGASVGAAVDAASGNPPWVHYLPFSFALALFGYMISVFRRGVLFCAVWALACFGLISFSLPVGWHQHRYLALLAPAMLLGCSLALNALPRAFKFALLSAWFAFGAFSAHYLCARQAETALSYQQQHGQAAAWLREHCPPGTRIGSVDAGILAYYSGLPTTDLLGITDHELAVQSQSQLGTLSALKARPEALRPSLLALQTGRPDFPLAPLGNVLREVATLPGDTGAGHFSIFAIDYARVPGR